MSLKSSVLSPPITPAPRDVWRDLLATDFKALPSHSPEWVDAIAASSAYEDASRLYEMGDRQFVLPMVRRPRGLGTFATEASFPEAWGIGGLVGTGASAGSVRAIFASLQSEGALRVSIRPNPLDADLWAAAAPSDVVVVPRTAHVLDLQRGDLWAGLSDTRRRGVRKAERSDLQIQCDTSGTLLTAYYRLFNRSIERWATKLREPLPIARWRTRHRDPLSKLQAIASRLGPAFQVWMASRNNEPVASIVVLKEGNAHYTRGAMDRELAGPVRANDLLHWLAISRAYESGCRHYHMGDSSPSGSLAGFKESFGARPISYAVYRMERLPITRADRLARRAVKRMIGFRDE